MTETDTSSLSLRKHWKEVCLCWLWFFLVLLSYYCLKPVRDGLASSLAENLGTLYAATFTASLVGISVYSRLVASIPRTWLLIGVYNFFIACLLGFFLLFASRTEQPASVVATFFVWVSVFNLFVVTLFWSVMADIFSPAQGKAWFGIIAAAGSVGSIAGSAIAAQLSQLFGSRGLLITSAIALELAVVVGWALMRMRHGNLLGPNTGKENATGTGGSILAGFTRVLKTPYLIGICLFVAIGKFAATFIYNNLQLVLKTEMPLAEDRTTLFSQMNLFAQSGSLFTQLLIAGWLMRQFGVSLALILPSTLMFGFFIWLSQAPELYTLVVGQVGQQILGYGLLVPAQHVLFTVVSREDKYKSKAFTDIVIFRGSDVAAGKVCDWMIRGNIAIASLALVMLPTVVVWGIIAWWTGRGYFKKSRQDNAEQASLD